jgi:3-oxoacid CoA-transferase B subunit
MTSGNGKIKFEGLPKEMIALRASKELQDGWYVNLGIGIPTLVSDWIEGRDIILQSEIGMIKTGPIADGDTVDQDLINASSQPVTALPGSACFDIAESFTMIRGGHMDAIIVGAMQVSETGDFASWNNPARGLGNIGGIGGSMDLCANAKRLIIAMEHTTNKGEMRVLKKCTYPLTAKGKVNLIITDLAVMEVTPSGLLLKEIIPGLTVEQLQSVTEPKLTVSPDLKEIQL